MQWPPGRNTASSVRAVPAVCYAVIVLGASVVEPPAGGLTPTGPLGLVGVDKWVHAVGYATLAVLLAYALRATTTRRLVVVAALAIAYGAGIEVVQSFLPFRAFSLADALANAVGVSLVVIVGLVSRCVTRVRSGRSGSD
ncbi:VanZ like family protein [Halorientalis persicus]|jgi:hypothetical protein|uniref:VanZ like family protein n=1 Tax=Halorientalis persicus TaxID=1367881 RepID=A0A1H8PJ00_9EURY|nr:VanZ family protein [Halorientalis persicus]SEO41648.1 VanZ like family protein [Halorientalis persicus]